jgi:hypothetical protein
LRDAMKAIACAGWRLLRSGGRRPFTLDPSPRETGSRRDGSC